ncbi:hypothetical protein BH23THE1_BH23THE1_13390 [soil metagenome]
MDSRTEKEYHLLRNYHKNGIDTRQFLLERAFDLYEMAKAQKWEYKRKIWSQCFIQLDIISKMMMYSEDIAVFSLAFLKGISFYDMLDKVTFDLDDATFNSNEINNGKWKINDLGKKIKEFYDDVEYLTDEDIYKIFSYKSVEKIDRFDSDTTSLISRNMLVNAKEIKEILKAVGSFGKTNHRFYKRFKHAVFPIMVNSPINFNESHMKVFETFNVAILGKEPFSELYTIPLSEKVILSYNILKAGMEKILSDMVMNRFICLDKGLNGIIPRSTFDKTAFTPDEHVLLSEAYKKFDQDNKSIHKQDSYISDINIMEEDFEWYKNLDDYIKQYEQVRQKNEDYNNRWNRR